MPKNLPTRDFYFLRHGQTDWNKEERMQGRTDIPLNETGREQARQAWDIIGKHPIDLIYASPLVRALETAQIVNQNLNVPLHKHDDLQERHYGSNEGLTFTEILAKAEKAPHLFKAKISKFPHPHDAEDIDDLKKRAVQAVFETLEKHTGNVLFVAHGGVFSAIHHVLIKGADYTRSENAVPYRFYISNGDWACEKL